MGGWSPEREISLASGMNVAEHLPRDKYEVFMLDTLSLAIGVEAYERGDHPLLRTHSNSSLPVSNSGLEPLSPSILDRKNPDSIDVAFIAIHGPYGEDGTLQGMLELLGIPYTGSGVLASALAMNKIMTKKLFMANGIPTAPFITLRKKEWEADSTGQIKRILSTFSLPVVVKPNKQGSSIGVSIPREEDELAEALKKSFSLDDEILVEEYIEGMEVTCGVIGNREPVALPVVEILPKVGFFDYEAKYDPEKTDEIVPARISPELTSKVQATGLRAHCLLGCRGMSRVDMRLRGDEVFVLEVNTIPGVTINSLLPKAAKAAGMSFPEFVDRIVSLALEE